MYNAISIDVLIAAYTGAMGSYYNGRQPSSVDPTSYLRVSKAALAYAEEFDTLFASPLPNELQLQDIQAITSEILSYPNNDTTAFVPATYAKTVNAVIALLQENAAIVAANVVNPIPIPVPSSANVLTLSSVVGITDSLRTTTPTTGVSAVVEGYYGAGDGGAAPLYYWSIASVATDNGGTVINPTGHVGAGRWLAIYSGPVHARWFGAHPVQSALVNTAAFEAAAAWQQAQGGGDVMVWGLNQVVTQNPAGTASPMRFEEYVNVVFVGFNKYTDGMYDGGAMATVAQPAIAGKGNALVTFAGYNGCGFRNMSIIGANEWSQARLDTGLTIESKKGVYFEWVDAGHTHENPICEDCYVAATEGEAIFLDSNPASSAHNVQWNRNHLFQVQTNALNISGDCLDAQVNDNYVDSPGQSAMQIGGKNLNFCRNICVMSGGYVTYAAIFLCGNGENVQINDNVIDGFTINVAPRPGISLGGNSGFNTNVSIERNKFANCVFVYAAGNDNAYIEISATDYDQIGIVIKDNEFVGCQGTTGDASPIVAIRFDGDNDVSGEISGNTIDNQGVANPLTSGVRLETGLVQVYSGIVIKENIFDSSVTHPYTFVVLPSIDVGQVSTPLIGANLTDADATIDISQGSKRVLPKNTLSANRTVTIDTTGTPAVNEILRIERYDTTNKTLAIVNGGPGAGTMYTFPASVARAADFQWNGTDWQLAGTIAITPLG